MPCHHWSPLLLQQCMHSYHVVVWEVYVSLLSLSLFTLCTGWDIKEGNGCGGIQNHQDSSSSRIVTSCVGADDLRRGGGAHGPFVGKWDEREMVLSDGMDDSLLEVPYGATTAAALLLLWILIPWPSSILWDFMADSGLQTSCSDSSSIDCSTL